MAGIVVIGGELDCAGFRLAGVDTRCPAESELAAEFARALADASLVVLTRRCADGLAPGLLRRALAREAPLVVVMPDIAAPQADTGLVRRIRGVLGISP
jgi:vacuolar-type H+-ATPase subunit F/Vma7